jgi:CRP/FNR family transcriptional regulator, cyclic AMP receptor protein
MTGHAPESAHRRPVKGPLAGGIIEDALRRDGRAPHSAPGGRAPDGDGLQAPRPSQVLLLDADPELAEVVPPAALTRAHRVLRATVSRYERGPVRLAEPSPTTFSLLVIGGAATIETRLSASARMLELVLPGDLLSPRPPGFSLPEHEVRLTALEHGLRVAALDHHFLEAAAVWPGLMTTIQQRVHDQAHRMALHSTICQLPRVEDRVIAVLSHLAARIGKVTPEGVIVPLSLRHEDLAAYVGARRPSVSLAIKMLRAQGRLHRRADDAWVLPPQAVPLEIAQPDGTPDEA